MLDGLGRRACKIFGLNTTKVYGLQPNALRRKIEYPNDPRPTFATYGPRDRAEFPAFKRWQGDGL